MKDNNVTSDKSNFKTPSSENNNNKLSTERRVSNKIRKILDDIQHSCEKSKNDELKFLKPEETFTTDNPQLEAIYETPINNKVIQNSSNKKDITSNLPQIQVNSDEETDDLQVRKSTVSSPRHFPNFRGVNINLKNRKRESKFIRGSLNNSGQFKSGESTLDLFIGNVNIDTEINDITDFILKQTKINCVNIEKLEVKSKLYNCFKITVKANDRDILLNGNYWPCGVRVKKYFIKRNKF